LGYIVRPPSQENKKEVGVVAHACNSIYSGGGDQEDHSLRLAQPKSWQDAISTNKN
jgi:hypothetical protein